MSTADAFAEQGIMELLVIEDDPVIGKALRRGFTEAGNKCTWVADGDEGLAQAKSGRYDAVVLDILLPGLSGLDVLRRLRAGAIHTPVILLTALGSIEERVEGLRAGADDYLVKPFAFPELMARIEAVCRRSQVRPSTKFELGDLVLDLTTRRVECGGRVIELTPTEFSLLEFLMRHGGQLVTRRMLCEHLWDSDWEGATNVIEVHINHLRRKIDRGREVSLIQTIRGRGYALRALENGGAVNPL